MVTRTLDKMVFMLDLSKFYLLLRKNRRHRILEKQHKAPWLKTHIDQQVVLLSNLHYTVHHLMATEVKFSNNQKSLLSSNL